MVRLLFRLTRGFSLIILIVFTAIWLPGCSAAGENWGMVAAGRPVIGLAVEKSEDREIALESQTRLRVNIDNGNIRITRGNDDKLLIRETLRIKGPASKERLGELLDMSKSKVESFANSISVDQKQSEEIKPLYGMADDIEFIIPESISILNISINNGTVNLSGLDGLRSAELSAVNGQIDVSGSSSDSIKMSVDKGNINIEDFSGSGSYECGRGDINLKAVSGSVDLTSVSGDAVIEESEGTFKCDMSSGQLTVRNSSIRSGSDLYSSTGSIDAELAELDSAGKLSVKSADADIRLKMPENKGYSLIARSTGGKVYNKMNPSPGTLKKSPTGEVYGDVAGGGISIEIYTDSGSVTLY